MMSERSFSFVSSHLTNSKTLRNQCGSAVPNLQSCNWFDLQYPIFIAGKPLARLRQVSFQASARLWQDFVRTPAKSGKTPASLRSVLPQDPGKLVQDFGKSPIRLRQDANRTLTGPRQNFDETRTGLCQDPGETPARLRQVSGQAAP